MRGIVENPYPPPEIQEQLDLDSINFVSNDRPGEIPANPPPPSAEEERRVAREVAAREAIIAGATS